MDQQVIDRLKEISLFASLADREQDLAEFLPIVKILSVTAGTTVIKNVPSGALAIARAQQRNVAGWVARKRRRTPPDRAKR